MDAAVQEDAASRGAVHLDLQDRLQWILYLCRSAIGIYVDFPESFLRNAFVFVDPKSCGYGAEVAIMFGICVTVQSLIEESTDPETKSFGDQGLSQLKVDCQGNYSTLVCDRDAATLASQDLVELSITPMTYYLKDLEEDLALAHYFCNVAIKTSRPEQVVGCLARNTSSGGQDWPLRCCDGPAAAGIASTSSPFCYIYQNGSTGAGGEGTDIEGGWTKPLGGSTCFLGCKMTPETHYMVTGWSSHQKPSSKAISGFDLWSLTSRASMNPRQQEVIARLRSPKSPLGITLPFPQPLQRKAASRCLCPSTMPVNKTQQLNSDLMQAESLSSLLLSGIILILVYNPLEEDRGSLNWEKAQALIASIEEENVPPLNSFSKDNLREISAEAASAARCIWLSFNHLTILGLKMMLFLGLLGSCDMTASRDNAFFLICIHCVMGFMFYTLFSAKKAVVEGKILGTKAIGWRLKSQTDEQSLSKETCANRRVQTAKSRGPVAVWQQLSEQECDSWYPTCQSGFTEDVAAQKWSIDEHPPPEDFGGDVRVQRELLAQPFTSAHRFERRRNNKE
ncbi:hypothetical protein Anapl_17153 [Anas platyrhynchos]|uniref:Uncharacterized protein n=1 Tax=Anas platyrhynchos TaxID=8839 RepID=R0KLN8_ANAPL|nr:hypothetical protein Anapl_17153 [Anas platyrhynchos]